MVIRKTPSGSNSSSKTKKLKVATSTVGSVAVSKNSKLKSTGKTLGSNPYPAGVSHG